MRFIETPIFTEAVTELLDDEEYRSLQLALLLRPESGPLIPRSGGLRKIRWALKGKGKRGGCRIIYYWDEPSETFTCSMPTARVSKTISRLGSSAS
jgi:mRNA-degrading endonuclease RelE of RelBE toxin-antitoxin system